MGSGHAHGQGGASAAAASRGRLRAVLAITLTVLAVEIAGGIAAHSLVLLADAGHLATDAAAIGLTLLAVRMGSRPATPERTFGYHRLEILAAVADSVLLFTVCVAVTVEAVHRLGSPSRVEAGPLVLFGLVAVAGNLASLALLAGGSRKSLAVRGAFLEVAGDLLGALAVLAAAAVIALTGWERADPVASLVVAGLIVPRTWHLLRDAVDVLLEATPKGVDMADVRRHLLDTPGVLDVHDLHAWTITSGMPVLSAHIVVRPEVLADGGSPQVLDALGTCLSDHFDVAHSTFQLEPAGHVDHEGARHI